MKNVYLISILIICLISCKKDTPKFIDVESPDITKYVLNLSGTKINHYSKYLNNVLQETTYFTDLDTIIDRITKNSSDKIIYKERFFIGSNDYAESSIDSCFDDNGLLYINTSTYQYNNGFLIESDLKYKHFGACTDSGVVTMYNNISDDNIISTKSYSCTDLFDYNDKVNLIDVRYFSNLIKGKVSKNLISHASWANGCPAGPSMTISHSDFEYEFNSNNYISKMRAIRTPCYHTGNTEEVTRTIYTTIYEYVW